MFKQSPFCMFSGCCLLLFVKAVCLFLKKIEHIVTYISIHTIQLIFLIQIATIFTPIFFWVLPCLQVGKLTHRPMPLMLD